MTMKNTIKDYYFKKFKFFFSSIFFNSLLTILEFGEVLVIVRITNNSD